MADESECPVCGGQHPVTWLITHLNPAATIRSCEQDFEAAVLALLANRLEVDAGWLTDVINAAVDAVNEPAMELVDEAESEADRAQPASRPKRRRAQHPTVAPAEAAQHNSGFEPDADPEGIDG